MIDITISRGKCEVLEDNWGDLGRRFELTPRHWGEPR